MSLLLAVDLGTEGARVGAFDADNHVLLGTESAAYPTTFPREAWAEQDPEDWWRAFVSAASALLDCLGRRDVAVITTAATSSTVVVCGADDRVLRPALLWMDARAGDEARDTAAVDHPVMRYSGGSDAVEWLVPKAMWLARYEPDVYARAAVIAEQVDFLNHRLTGTWARSRLNATCKWNYDPVVGGFHDEVFAAFGVPDLRDKLPDRIVAVGDVVDVVRAEVVDSLQLDRAPLVAQGGIDAHMAMLGAGTLGEGDLLLVGGTSVVHLCHASRPAFTPSIWGPYPDALIDGWWIVEGGQVSGGSVLRWLAETIFGLDREGHRALAVEALASPRSGLLTLDHLMGNRTPYRDPWLRGAMVGLTLSHDRVALYRSAVEGVALGTRNVVDAFSDADVDVRRVVATGGILRNPLWLQLTADVLDLPLQLAADDNLSLVAGAVAGATAAGIAPDLASASTTFARTGGVVEPDARSTAHLHEQLARYRQSTDALRGLMHDLAGDTKHQPGEGIG